jgi:hypothetical protein
MFNNVLVQGVQDRKSVYLVLLVSLVYLVHKFVLFLFLRDTLKIIVNFINF